VLEVVYGLEPIEANSVNLTMVLITYFLSNHQLLAEIVQLEEPSIFDLVQHFTRLEALVFCLDPWYYMSLLVIDFIMRPEVVEVCALSFKICDHLWPLGAYIF
jgi:hypothetical protein